MLFGSAGVPIQCEERSTYGAVKCIHALGLSALEIQFVRGVKMGESLAKEVGKLAKELNVVISSHAPYYINLASKDEAKAKKSIFHIVSSARATQWANGYITVIHPGYYQNLSKEEAYTLVKERLSKAEEELRGMKVKTLLGIETMGKHAAFGKLDEVLRLSQELTQVFPVIDFAHLRAINYAKFKDVNDYIRVFDEVEKALGREAVEHFHVHFSEIEFTEKGERNHLPLTTKYEPDYRAFIRACVENGYDGVVISESPKLDIDAQLMQRYYEEIA